MRHAPGPSARQVTNEFAISRRTAHLPGAVPSGFAIGMQTLVTLQPEDAATLSELWQDTFSQAYSAVHSTANIDAYCAENFSLAKAESALRDPNMLCKAVRLEDTAAGFYVLRFSPCPLRLPGRSAELKQIYVLAKQYGSGLGQTLYQDALNELKCLGTDWVWLAVSDRNHRAQAFYRKLEFIAKGPGPIFKVGTDRLSSTLLVRAL